MIQTVVKRDGRIVGFNEEKIITAIRKAMLHTDKGEDMSLIRQITDHISFRGDAQMTVDLIKELINLHPVGPLIGEVAFALFEEILIQLSVTADMVDMPQSIETTWNLGCLVDDSFDNVPFAVSAG